MLRSDGMSLSLGRSVLAGLALSLAACTPASPSPAGTPASADAAGPRRTIEKAKACPGGQMTYLGFRGTGQPPVALLDEILKRFPDALVYEVGEGSLGVLVAEHHSMEVRARHEAAAAAVGWKGDVVDFASVTKTCEASFHTPVPLPPPR